MIPTISFEALISLILFCLGAGFLIGVAFVWWLLSKRKGT